MAPGIILSMLERLRKKPKNRLPGQQNSTQPSDSVSETCPPHPFNTSLVHHPASKYTSGPPNDYARPTIFDSEMARRHYIPDDQHPRTQQLVARIVKGFVNVCDIVEIDGQFYSAEVQLPDISQADTVARGWADCQLLESVFGDTDRWLPDHNVKSDIGVHFIFRTSSGMEPARYTSYDFEVPYLLFWVKRPINLPKLPSAYYEALIEKLNKFISYYASEEGKAHLQDIFNHAGVNITEIFHIDPAQAEKATVENVHKTLMRRAYKLRAVAQKELKICEIQKKIVRLLGFDILGLWRKW